MKMPERKRIKLAKVKDYETLLQDFVDNAGWTREKRADLFKCLCKEKVLMPIHARIVHYVLVCWMIICNLTNSMSW